MNGPPPAALTAPELWPVAVLLAALWLCFRFALSHAAISAVSRTRLRALGELGQRRAEVLASLLGRRDAVQAALRLGFNAGLVTVAATAWWLAASWPGEPRQAVVIAFAGLALVALGAELVPRLAASVRPETTALRLARWVVVSYRLLGPLARLALRDESLAPRDEQEEEAAAESLRELMDTSPLRATQRRRITEILEFPDRTAGEVMVPRIDMVCVAADSPLAAVAAAIVDSGYSRLPVYAASKDDIVGIAHARDVLARLPGEGAADEVARRPLFVGEAMRLDQLLREMRALHSSVAVVVDEYGGTAGMVTIEDIIEEIVGEIEDETDVAEQGIRPRPEGGWLVPGRTGLDELGEALGLELDESAEIQTVGGLVMSLAGDLPSPGQVVVYGAGPWRLLLLTLAVDGARIAEVAVLAQPRAEGEAEEESSPGEAILTEVAEAAGDASLDWLQREAGLDPIPTAGATLAELFEFWPAGKRAGRELVWRTLTLSVVAETADAPPAVRVEPMV